MASMSGTPNAAVFWQCNLLIQSVVFVYFPTVGFCVSLLIKSIDGLVTSKALATGFVVLCCLPTTISSAVVLTINAGGNESVAVVNTALSNICGIVVTPALLFLFVGALESVSMPSILLTLFCKVIVPFATGQLHRYSGFYPFSVARYDAAKPKLKRVSEALLLFIVFTAIADSAHKGTGAKLTDVIVVALLCFLMHCTALALVWTLCQRLGGGQLFAMKDRVAILFCACQKTAAFGVPLIDAIYSGNDNLALFLVPLLIFHPLQLVVDSFVVPICRRKIQAIETAEHCSVPLESDCT